MTMVIGFAVAAAGLMGAGSALYSPGTRGTGSAGWAGWCAGQLALVLLILSTGAPPLALLAPLLGMAAALPRAWPARAADWPKLALPAIVSLWCLLLVGPARTLAMSAEIRLAFALLSGLVGAVAGWPLVAAACAGGRSLAWLLWSAGYGLAVLALMAARIDWPFLVFPLLAQGVLLAAGLAAAGAADSVLPRAEGEPDGDRMSLFQ
ncbi:MAG: hypothetical protein U1E34_13040 [Amaricoccus sp.]